MEQKPHSDVEVRQTLIVLRIIVFALTMGVSIFTGFVLFMKPGEPPKDLMLWMIMAGFAGAALLARAVVPGILFSAIRRKISLGTWSPSSKNGAPAPKTDDGLLMLALQQKTIVGCAILEAPAFANTFAYMSERQVASLVVALVLILLIAAHFPLRGGIDRWLESQKRWLDEDRSLRPSQGTE